MDFSELVSSRRTIQVFKSEKIADEAVAKALELSLWAPNHRLTFPWRFFWIEPRTREKLADLSAELKGAQGEKANALRATVTTPSHLILLGVAKTGDAEQNLENYATVACSVEIISLELWRQGIGSKWSTGGYARHARTYEILGVSPEEVQLAGALMIGVPTAIPKATPRPTLGQFLRRI